MFVIPSQIAKDLVELTQTNRKVLRRCMRLRLIWLSVRVLWIGVRLKSF